MDDKYFWRQLFILCTILLSTLHVGFMMAFPSALNPAITASNSTDIKTTDDHASWITTMNGIGGLIGTFILSPILDMYGRKACYYSMNAFYFIGWMIFPFAKDITALYAAMFIQGIGFGGIFINSFIISEYVHPCRRGYFLTMKKATIIVGILLCHAMSAFWTWRQIAIFAGIPPCLSLFLAYFWPESPSYLALKGQFIDCENAFTWLNGNSEESREHLKTLMETQRKKNARKSIENNYGLVRLMKKFQRKDFQKPFLITLILIMSVDLSGRFYYIAYIIQIMTELMNSKSSALYITIGTDLLTIIAVFIFTVVIQYANRRTILFFSGTTCVILMLLTSVLVYLKTIYTFSTLALWFTALMIIIQSFFSCAGIIPVAYTIISEIFPVEHKGFASFTLCFVFTCLYATIFKIASVLMTYTKLYGTYGIFGIVLAACLIILYKIVPETKDKTLQEIENDLSDESSKQIILMESEKLVH